MGQSAILVLDLAQEIRLSNDSKQVRNQTFAGFIIRKVRQKGVTGDITRRDGCPIYVELVTLLNQRADSSFLVHVEHSPWHFTYVTSRGVITKTAYDQTFPLPHSLLGEKSQLDCKKTKPDAL